MITDRDRRGAQVFALDLAAGLRRLGATVDTIALIPGQHGDLLPVRALGPRRFGFRTLKELRRVAGNSDVVVAHGSSTLPASTLALMGTGTRIVYRQVSDPTFWASSWPRRLRVAALLRRTAAVVALTSRTSATLQRHYWIRKRPAITVIPNAVSGEHFRPPSRQERGAARAALGIPVDSAVILCVGALAAEKGIDLAIMAVAGIEGARLLLVGDGPLRKELEALASSEMPNRCWFVGSMNDPRVAYWSADLLISPSRSESMPAVLIEAGLCGLASVATEVGETKEVIDHGVTGLIVRSGDATAIATAVVQLMGDPESRSAMGSAASDLCRRRFTISSTAPAWFELFAALAVEGGKHAGG